MTDEKGYLREMAKKYASLANMDIMRKRTELWKRHNSLRGERPLIVMEMATFENDLLPPLQCTSEFGRRMEQEMLRHIINFELIGDDKVVPDYFPLAMYIEIELFGLRGKRKYAEDSSGRRLGFADEHVITDLKRDLPRLGNTRVLYNADHTAAYYDFACDVLDGIMPVRIKNHSLEWLFAISERVIELMGMELLMMAFYDAPDELKQLFDFICNDMIQVLRTQEKARILTPNNGNDYAGAGSYGFTDELEPSGDIVSSMLWGNMNSQATFCISAEMFGEFIFPAYERLAREFGLLYYGCCEQMHPIWHYVSKLHNLRKVSVSAWCDEEFMGERLRNSRVIYSRKPSPNYIGVDSSFDEEAYTAHIEKTLRAAKGCTLEIIVRDVYTLCGQNDRAKRAVNIIRRLIDNIW